MLQEGINEDGATASFTAAGTAYSLHGIPIIPFYIYYSMFGFQRVGDMVWAAADMMCKGFLLGGTAGRTTLNGEGLQHQDGHSLLLAQTMPSVINYDPAFAYELAVIVHDGLRRMYVNNEHKLFYITLYNENYSMPAMPQGSEEGIKRGLYKFKTSMRKVSVLRARVRVRRLDKFCADAPKLNKSQIIPIVWALHAIRNTLCMIILGLIKRGIIYN